MSAPVCMSIGRLVRMRKFISGGVILPRFSAAAKNLKTSSRGRGTQTRCLMAYSPLRAVSVACDNCYRARNDHSVDDVNDAVRRDDIGRYDLGSVDEHVSVAKRHTYRFAVDRFDF